VVITDEPPGGGSPREDEDPQIGYRGEVNFARTKYQLVLDRREGDARCSLRPAA